MDVCSQHRQCALPVIYIYMYIYICIYIYNTYNTFFSPAGGTLKFKIGVKKSLSIFKGNLTTLMCSCCHLKIWLV